jgi:hypothetical protein
LRGGQQAVLIGLESEEIIGAAAQDNLGGRLVLGVDRVQTDELAHQVGAR